MAHRFRSGLLASLAFLASALGATASCDSVLGIQDGVLEFPDGYVYYWDAGEDGTMGSEAASEASPGEEASPGTDAGEGGSPACANPCPMATNLNHPFAVASDANNVYWVEFGDEGGGSNGAVKACPLSGCPASGPTVYAQGLTNPPGIAVDAQNVYFGTSNTNGSGGIWSCPISGCTTPKMLAPAQTPFGLGVNGGYVYWVDYADSTVHRALTTSAGDMVLYDAASQVIYEPYRAAVDDAFVYVTDYLENLYRVPVGGGEPVVMYNAVTNYYGQPEGVAVDDSGVYFAQQNEIVAMPKSGVDGGGAVVLATGQSWSAGVAIDRSTATVYWANVGYTGAGDGIVGRVGEDGGAMKALEASLTTPYAVTVSGGYVFWVSLGQVATSGCNFTTNGSGVLYRAPK